MIVIKNANKFGTCQECEARGDLFTVESRTCIDLLCEDCLPWCDQCGIEYALSEDHDLCEKCNKIAEEEDARISL